MLTTKLYMDILLITERVGLKAARLITLTLSELQDVQQGNFAQMYDYMLGEKLFSLDITDKDLEDAQQAVDWLQKNYNARNTALGSSYSEFIETHCRFSVHSEKVRSFQYIVTKSSLICKFKPENILKVSDEDKKSTRPRPKRPPSDLPGVSRLL